MSQKHASLTSKKSSLKSLHPRQTHIQVYMVIVYISLYEINKISVCVSFSVPKDLANHWTDIFLQCSKYRREANSYLKRINFIPLFHEIILGLNFHVLQDAVGLASVLNTFLQEPLPLLKEKKQRQLCPKVHQ